METMAERTAGFECVACRLDGHVAVIEISTAARTSRAFKLGPYKQCE